MTKEELRKIYLQKRKDLTPNGVQIISDQICELLFKTYNLEEKSISLFLPIEHQNEINTYQIWEKAKTLRSKIAVPKVNMDTNDLKHILFESIDQLQLSKWKIPEPAKGTVISPEKFDYVLVPLLACDIHGNRIGYGKGYYDRFLKKCSSSCKFIGLSHFDLTEKIVDIQHFDIQLHACITPDKIYTFEKIR